MRSAVFIALVLGVLFASVCAQEVVVLTSDNFESTIAEKDLALVEFFAPWCGHCKALAPKFAAAAEALSAAGITNAIVASVDCTTEASVCEQFEVQGYPTLIAFKKDTSNPIKYNGARETDAIVNFIKKKSASPVTVVGTSAELDALAAKENSVVLFGGAAEDVVVFSDAADADDVFVYYHVADETIAKAASVNTPSIKLYRSFDKTPADFTTFPLEPAALADFLDANGYPLVSEINQDSYQRLSKRPFPLIILVVDFDSAEKDQWLADLNTLAAEYPKLSLTYAPSSQLLNAVKQFGGTGDVVPTFIGFVVPGMGETDLPPRFAWPEDDTVNVENARKWFDSILAGTPKVHKKSEPVPEDNSAPVKIIVASQFEELVTKSGKNVLVEFYAPWCGHCKALVGTYDAVGARYEGIDSVVIGKMDATENFVDPAYNVQGFPTILLFKADGTHVSFEGERTVEGFLDFIEKETGVKAHEAASDSEPHKAKPAADGHDEL